MGSFTAGAGTKFVVTSTYAGSFASNLGTLNTTITPSISLINTTAATSTQDQISPALRFTSNGWKTNATAASQTDSVDVFLYPASAQASPSAQLRFIPTINGSAVPGLAITGSISGNGVLAGTYLTGFDGVNSFGGNNLAGFCGFGPAGGANSFAVYANAGSQIAFSNGYTTLGSTHNFGWGSASYPGVAAPDVVLTRDAANTLAQRNGTNWQAFNIYSTYTDASNYDRFEIRQSGASWYIGSGSAGTGPGNRNINLTANGQLLFGANGGTNWLINTSGHFLANTDNTNDIGASAANRPRTVFAGTSVLAPYVRTSTAYTVATLPAAGTAGAGARAYVTDANATTFASIVAGGGANIVPVMSNGTNWIIG